MSEDMIYLILVVGSVLVILIAIYCLMFAIIPTYGALEESDDSYDFYGIRFIRYKKGNWMVNVGSIFDDNAVVRLKIPLIFRMLFYDWEIEIMSKGKKTGSTFVKMSKDVYVYRRRIRRR